MSEPPAAAGLIIPRPVSAAASGPPVTLSDGCVISCDAASRPAGQLLRSWLENATGWQVGLTGEPAGQAGNIIRLRADTPAGEAEGYELSAAGAVVSITGASPAGVFCGVQTLRLLLPPGLLRAAPPGGLPAAPVAVPGVHITDRPRLSWRGVHLDVARHFMPVHWILRLIDLIALHKLNVLHLHLTDDQGWRVEIERYPRLTEVGAWRRESSAGHGREGRFDGVPHGGWYSKKALSEIAGYAARQHVLVVPEIDMPGHMQAAIAAYPELGNSARPVEVRTSWGISDTVLNLDDTTIRFCTDVLDEVMDVFPGRYVHLGGDECPVTEWQHSAGAQRRMAELGLAQERLLQGWFTGQVAGHVSGRGRTPVLWDEAAESGAPEDAVIMAWRSEQAGWQAAGLGHQVVMAPQERTYLDWAQDDSPAEPLAIRAGSSLRRVHGYDPVPSDRSPQERSAVLGAQCQLWTEYVPDTSHAEYMYFPRLCAFADRAWSAQPGDFDEFAGRLGKHLAYLDALGVNYRPPDGPPPGQARTWQDPAADRRGDLRP